MVSPLVSIIIPTFNRAHFLGETLDSIILQTYTNWECIVVDDGSSDETDILMEFYCKMDSRIRYYNRPDNYRKGANACRNYGFELSTGDFMQWFDSDDLMIGNSIEAKINEILKYKLDFVIAKTECFEGNNPEKIIHRNDAYYKFEEFEINNYNYVTQKINWLTYDFMGKRELLEQLRFNESLEAFQERNFFSKLTCFSVNTRVIDTYLTKVRLHPNSIQSRLKIDEAKYYKQLQDFFFITWLELKPIAPKESVKFLFERTIDYTMNFKRPFKNILYVCLQYLKEKKLTSLFWYSTFHLSFLITGKGLVIKRKLLRLR